MRALNNEASRLVTMLGPDEGGGIFHGLPVVYEVTRKSGELPQRLVREGAGADVVLCGVLIAVLGCVDRG